MVNTPEISVVICTYNRQKFLPECLNCLSRQTIRNELWEVIIVDNASTDQTAEIAKQWIADNRERPFRYVLESRKGLSFARNRGIVEARSNVVTYIDDDAETVPVFAEALNEFMKAHPEAAGAGGMVIPKYSESPEPAWMNPFLKGFVGLVDFGNKPKAYVKGMKYPIGCNMTYRKNLLLQAGGFNNQLTFRGDDKYIFYAVTKINPLVYYVPKAKLYHNIDAGRLQHDYFKRLFLKTGNEEKIRVLAEQGKGGLVKKFLEYIFKFGASLFIWAGYRLKGKNAKGYYTMLSQWYTLQGFLKKSVFVR